MYSKELWDAVRNNDEDTFFKRIYKGDDPSYFDNQALRFSISNRNVKITNKLLSDERVINKLYRDELLIEQLFKTFKREDINVSL